jgi:hypothetical protein
MPRPKRKKIEFTEESVNNLFQEIYDENHNIKAQITRLFTKWETRIKEEGNIAAIGDQVVKLIAAQAKNQDQKIMVLRYLKEIVFIKDGGGGTAVSSGTQSSDSTEDVDTARRNELIGMVADEFEIKLNELENKDKD